MMTINQHPSYLYAASVVNGNARAPKYVVKQCKIFLEIANDKNEKYIINTKLLSNIDKILKVLKMAKGQKAGRSIYSSLAGYQWLLIVAVLCTVWRENKKKRRYETAILEICRKNGKTFVVAVLFLILFFIEPNYSRFFSVAPDGALAKEIKEALDPLIRTNIEILGGKNEFNIRRDYISMTSSSTKYVPLNYSTNRMDGKEPNVFIADEVGALPTSYAVEAMRSGQLLVKNRLGFIISTKYPTTDNPIEDEVDNAKKVLDELIDDETIFALLYEPDDKKNWTTNDDVIADGNPLALEMKSVWNDLIKKRQNAINRERLRENFLTKHCNIAYQGAGTESYIPIDQVQACRVEKIDWNGRNVYIGLDLAMTNDNCSVAMVSADDDNKILADVIAFIPDGRIEEKSQYEKIDYHEFIRAMKCISCGDMTVDYGVIEDFVFQIENKYGVHIVGIGYDRYNALSSAQKFEERYTTVEIRQHSDTLHPPTKLLAEKIADKNFEYEDNRLLEINFENAKCTYDTNMNRYVNKKRSRGKVDMVVALINAVYLLQQDVIFDDSFVCQT